MPKEDQRTGSEGGNAELDDDVIVEIEEELVELSTDQIEVLVEEAPSTRALAPPSAAKGNQGPKSAPPRRRLGEILVDAGIIDADQLREALAYQAVHRGRLGSMLVALGMLSEQELEGRLGQQLGITVASVTTINPTPLVLRLLPEAKIRSLQAIPLRIEGSSLVMGLTDPTSGLTLDELRRLCRREIVAELITDATFHRFVRMRFGEMSLRPASTVEIEVLGGEEEERSVDANTVIEFILDSALRRGATDVHIEPHENFSRVRLRLDGTLHTVLTPPRNAHQAVIAGLREMAHITGDDPSLSQEGYLHGRSSDAELRLSIIPTVHGEMAILRVMRRELELKDLSQLGLHPNQLSQLLQVAQERRGLLLVAGPRGSGRSTTLHAVLNSINEPDINIIAVGDPGAATIPGVNHVALSPGGLPAAEVLRSVLRQDADVVMVGDVDQADVAGLVVHATVGGPFMLSTLHGHGCLEALGRLSALVRDPWTVGAALQMILSQRLVRRVCGSCARPIPLPDSIILELKLTEQQAATSLYRKGEGCTQCHGSGYRGRIGVFESIRLDARTREAIRNGASEPELRALATGQTVISLREAGIARALAGDTTWEELSRILGEGG